MRSRFGKIKKLSEIWKSRLLLFVGRTTRQPELRLSYKAITATTHSKRIIGWPFRTNKDAIVEITRELVPSTPHFGNTEYWYRHASDATIWESMVKNLGVKTYAKYTPTNNDNNSRNNTRQRAPPPQSQKNYSSLPSPPPRQHNSTNNSNMTKTNALRLLDLPINATRREVIMQFRILSRSYHPDKWSPSKSFSKE